jgi:Phage integrase family
VRQAILITVDHTPEAFIAARGWMTPNETVKPRTRIPAAISGGPSLSGATDLDRLEDRHETGQWQPAEYGTDGVDLVLSHMLRHAAGYKLVNDRQPIRAIQQYLGHRRIESTERYTEIDSRQFNEFFGYTACSTMGRGSLFAPRWRADRPPGD